MKNTKSIMEKFQALIQFSSLTKTIRSINQAFQKIMISEKKEIFRNLTSNKSLIDIKNKKDYPKKWYRNEKFINFWIRVKKEEAITSNKCFPPHSKVKMNK